MARLHAELLPTSPAVRFGPRFLEHFYYRVLPEEDLVFGSVAYEADEPVGFVVATRSANTFLQTAARRRWRDLAAALLRHPPPPRAVVDTLRLANERRGEVQLDIAEILSLGVRPAPPRSSPERRRLARDLIRSACDRLGPVPVQALVDEHNLAARLMYNELGWDVTGTVTAGWPVPQLVFTHVPA